ncbi:MAG: AEC family transporter [Kiritimatiellae bacterium]|jgi:predicted permease|nr:AEC family transporter [Kiritimatiellia bacterium]
MQQALYILNVLFPIFAILALGFFLFKIKLLTPEMQKGLNKLAFFVGLSSMLFLKIAQADLNFSVAWKITVAHTVTMLVSALVAYILAKACKYDRPTIGAIVQIGYRSNMFYLGIPIILFVIDGVMDTATKDDLLSDLFIGVTPVMVAYNILAVIVLTTFSEETKKPSPAKITLNVLKNPLIIAAIAGGIFAVYKIPIPKMCERTLDSLAGIAFPLALIGIGSTLAQVKDFSILKSASWGIFVKLIISPIICFSMAYFLGLRGYMLLATGLLSATPTAISSYIMADQMKCNSHLTAVAIAATTLLSFITIATILYIFSMVVG